MNRTPSFIHAIRRMSDNNRRLVCRLLFLALCAVPTMSLVYWITHRPGIREWQEAVQAKLGVEIEIDSLETPRPGETILRGIRVNQPFGKTVHHINEITVMTAPTHRVVVSDMVSVAPEDLLELIHQASQHAFLVGRISQPWQIEFQTVAVDPNPDSSDLGLVLSPLQIDIRQDDHGVMATANFQRSGIEDSESMECQVFYPHEPQVLRPEIYVDTRGNRLPCWLATDFVEDLASMGEEATFSGTATLLIDDENRVSGKLTGVFDQINLHDLGEPVHQRLSGMAQANVLECEIVEDRLRRLHAKLQCAEGGWISPQVLISAQHHLNLQSTGMRARNQFIPYSSFGVEFLLDPPNDRFLVADLREEGLIFDKEQKPLLRCSYVEVDNQLQAYPLRIIDVANFWIRPSAQVNRQMVANSSENLLANHGLIRFLNRLDRQAERTAALPLALERD
ncbi:MAG: hypothetical protein VYE64_08280 [Planctomycetota bacterium]|nr:hypothetical protein [Planctomycetota bacterium]